MDDPQPGHFFVATAGARQATNDGPWRDLPMGTHWRWHVFGAVTTQALYEYFYRLEGDARTD